MTQTANPSTSTPAAAPKSAGGLQGVVASQSGICFIDGNAGELVYRGYDIGDVVENLTFEETSYLLWKGDLPKQSQLDAVKKDLAAAMPIPGFAVDLLRALPKTMQPMDALRTVVSGLGAADAEVSDNSPEANFRKAVRLTAQLPSIVTTFHRLRTDQKLVEPNPSLSIAGNFLAMLFGKPADATITRVMDAALVLHAEHGMNASTFTARVVAATLADMHAAVTGALGALKGPLHGGANQDVMELLLQCNTPDEIEALIKKKLAAKDKVPGFGHRVYRVFDPRATFLMKMSKQLADAAGTSKWYAMQERLVPLMKNTPKSDGTPMNLNPNVDFFSATAYYTMGIPLDLFTPIFAVARIAGWTAHIMEQHANNRIIRPTDDYTGPRGLKVVPIEKR